MNFGRNVLANIAGRLWTALMGFAFVPLYIGFMGIEAYGLIGFFASMLSVFAVLDLGLSTTVNREMALMQPTDASRMATRDLLRTLEVVYWAIAVVLALGMILGAPFIATAWLQADGIPVDVTTRAIRMMGLTALLRWPVSLYLGALLGLHRQVEANALTALGATLQGGGAVLVLWLVSPGIDAFFGWQVIAAGIQTGLMVWAAWRHLSLPGHAARPRPALLRPLVGFSAGVGAITLLSVVLTQLDKIVLTALLPLRVFGYYALASTIAMTLLLAAGAVYAAIFPALTKLVAAGRTADLAALYHRGSQLMALLVIPAAVSLAIFSPLLLQFYVADPIIASSTHPLLSMMVVGNATLSLMLLPLALQLAHGWTRLSLNKNIVAVLLFVPMLFFMVERFGAPGAAAVWIMLTTGYLLIEVPVMHRFLLRGEAGRWYLLDLGAPLLVSIVILGAVRWAIGEGPWDVGALAACLAGSAAALLVAAGSVPAGRALYSGAIRRVARPDRRPVPADQA